MDLHASSALTRRSPVNDDSLRSAVWLAGVLVVLSAILNGSASAAEVSRINVNGSGMQADSASGQPAVSRNGRFVAFESSAANLVADDSNGQSDIFLRDRKLGTTRSISVDATGRQANGYSYQAEISANGSVIAFLSDATNLAPGDTNLAYDVYVHDRASSRNERISLTGPNATTASSSRDVQISGDGQVVAFASQADDLVAGDTNGWIDVFVHDRRTGLTERVSVGTGGREGDQQSSNPSLSVGGRYVAFESFATNLVADDTNGRIDLFIHDRNTGTTTRVNPALDGIESDGDSFTPRLSATGRVIAFQSNATNLVDGDSNGADDVFVHDLDTSATTRISEGASGEQGNQASFDPTISADGSTVAFVSSADNLVAGDTNAARDVFVRRRDAGVTSRVSVDSMDREASDSSFNAALSADGRWVVFDSLAENISEPDTNGQAATDVFIADRGAECDVTAANNRFVLPDNQWVTLSLPCEPPPGTTVADLFADDIDGAFGFSGDWAVYTLDTSATVPIYRNPGLDGSLAMGSGFWMIQRTGISVTLDLPEGSRGIASNFEAGSACAGVQGCVNTALSGAPQPAPVDGQETPRWTLLGNPFNTGVAHDDLRVVTEAGGLLRGWMHARRGVRAGRRGTGRLEPAVPLRRQSLSVLDQRLGHRALAGVLVRRTGRRRGQ